MQVTFSLLLATAAYLHTATAATDGARTLEVESDGAYRYGTPNYIDDSDFDAALQRPNATGSVSFTGRNVSAPWPGSELDGWTLQVNVTSDIIKPGADHRQLTGSAISLSQPASLSKSYTNNGTDGFQVCVNVMRIVPNATANYTKLAAEDNGSCESYLSQTCRLSLQTLASTRFVTNGTCEYINDPPPACGNVTFNTVGSNWDEPAFGLPAQFYQQGWTAFTYGSDPPVASANRTLVLEDYDEMSKSVYPVLITWGYTNSSSDVNDSPTASLACVSATDFTEESRVPDIEDGSTSAVGRMGVDSAWVVVLSTAVGFVLYV